MEKFSSYVITLEESPDSQSNYRNWSNCVRTHTHTNGDQYIGEWQDGKYHGQGTFTAAYGGQYVGEYKNGKQHGQGTFTWVDGEQYEGDWKNDKRQGQGTYNWADGEISTGIWVNRTCIKTLSFQSLQKTRH